VYVSAELKLDVLRVYHWKLEERLKRTKFARDHRLFDMAKEKRFLSENKFAKDIITNFHPFLQLFSRCVFVCV